MKNPQTEEKSLFVGSFLINYINIMGKIKLSIINSRI